MRHLSILFFFGVALIALMSATCKEREKNPGRPFQTDTTTNPGGGGGGTDKGYARVTTRLYTVAGQVVSNAEVKISLTLSDALAGTYFLKQNTDATGSTIFELVPGGYYMVATYQDSQGILNTSDTTKVRGYAAGPPPTSQANGPQFFTVTKMHTQAAPFNVNTVMDIRE